MESEQSIENSPLIQSIEKVLPKMNFYRFCQLLEQIYADEPVLGRYETPVADPLRFAPASDMSFPSSELKVIERSLYVNRPTTVRTRFLGLYGVDSVLPLVLLNNIICRDENYHVMTDFLDMFNHRIITQFYRIWLKYQYPASFLPGGKDNISQCVLGLTGFGIKGTSEQIAAPSSRFLALLGLITQRTRTAEGIIGVVKLLVSEAKVYVSEFLPVWQPISKPAKLGGNNGHRISLSGSEVLGSRFRECNQTIKITIQPQHQAQITELLPSGALYKDLFAMLRAYLGYQIDANLILSIERRFLPRSQLVSNNCRLGQTASLAKRNAEDTCEQDVVLVNIGQYSGIEYAA